MIPAEDPNETKGGDLVYRRGTRGLVGLVSIALAIVAGLLAIVSPLAFNSPASDRTYAWAIVGAAWIAPILLICAFVLAVFRPGRRDFQIAVALLLLAVADLAAVLIVAP